MSSTITTASSSTTTTTEGWTRKPGRTRFKPRESGKGGSGKGGSGKGGSGPSAAGMSPPPAKRKKKTRQPTMEIVAPQATLDGLPDNVVLLVMNYLNLLSLVRLALVCRRFNHLSTDTSVWETVELTRNSIGRKINSQMLKKLIRLYLTPSLRHVTLEESYLRGNATITEATVDLLFNSCPHIQSITLLNCDLRKFTASCQLFTCECLKSVSFKGCELSMDWMSMLKPAWTNLEMLCLENCAKTNNRDIQYVASKREWQKSLRYLNLSGCYRISFEVLKEVCTSLSALRTLDLHSGNSILNVPQMNKITALLKLRKNVT